jgi:hypothetical protein
LRDAPVAERLHRAIAFMIDRSSKEGAEWRSAIAMIVKAEQNSIVDSINQASYLDHLHILVGLFEELSSNLNVNIDSEAESTLLLTAADGLALATATLGKKAVPLSHALNRFLAKHYDTLGI